jgi:glycosyltransferase involved in cell wall biosynthesis
MRILSLSTSDIPCGVATYNAALKSAVEDLGHTYDVEPISYEMRGAPNGRGFAPFLQRLQQYDAAIIQHEFGLYGPTPHVSRKNFSTLLSGVRSSGKPTLTFLHTDLPPRRKARPFSFTSIAARERASHKGFIRSINLSKRARFIVHGKASHSSFISYGVEADRLLSIFHPMTEEQERPPCARKNADEVKLGVFGFIADYKGYEAILQAMTQLPEKFKLVIAGGRHPENANDLTLNNIYGFLAIGAWPNPTLPPIQPLSADAADALRSRISVTGYLQPRDVDTTLDDVDIVLAPYTETGPSGSGALSVCLARGKPIIASGTPGFVEIHKAANCIKLVPIQAPFELANTIKELADNKAEMKRLSSAALGFAKQHTFTALASRCVDTLRVLD